MAPRVLRSHRIQGDRTTRQRPRQILLVRGRRKGGSGERAVARHRDGGSLTEHRDAIITRNRIEEPNAIRVEVADKNDVERRRVRRDWSVKRRVSSEWQVVHGLRSRVLVVGEQVAREREAGVVRREHVRSVRETVRPSIGEWVVRVEIDDRRTRGFPDPVDRGGTESVTFDNENQVRREPRHLASDVFVERGEQHRLGNSAERARAYAKRLDAELAVVDKRRSEDGTAEVMNVIGDVQGRTCILQDDIIDTAGTICKAAVALKEAGAERVLACAVHGVLSGPAIERIEKSPLDQLIVTNSVPLRGEAQNCKKIVVLTVARLLGQAIRNIHEETSVSSLFV